MGQTKTVRVFQLIAADTVEAKVLDIRESIMSTTALTAQRNARTPSSRR